MRNCLGSSLFIVVLIPVIYTHDPPEEHMKTACEGELINLECSEFSGMAIESAFYGRDNFKDCPLENSTKTKSNSTKAKKTDKKKCVDSIDQDWIEWRIKQTCQHMTQCSVPVNSAFFGLNETETCANVFKFARVDYRCRTFDAFTWLSRKLFLNWYFLNTLLKELEIVKEL